MNNPSHRNRFRIGPARPAGAIGLAPLLVLMACGGDPADPIGPTTVPGNTVISVVSGDQQVGEVGTELGQPLTIRVTSDGAPVALVPVSWAALPSGSIVGDGLTDGDGRATARWTLSTEAGLARASASVGAPHAARTVQFRATARAGEPASLQLYTDPVATGGAVVANVALLDRHGNGVSERTVTVDVGRDGEVLTTASAMTQGHGVLTMRIPLDPLGDRAFGLLQLRARSGGGLVDETGFRHAHFWLWDAGVFPGDHWIAWSPQTVTVRAGTTVHWTFATHGHGLTLSGIGRLDQGGPQPLWGSLAHRFDEPGTYTFACPEHPSQTREGGTVVVIP